MSPRALRILVVPEEVDDAVDFPVSRRKLAEFVRRSEQFGEVEKKLEETQGELKNAREKIEDLKRKLERAKNSLTAVGADAKTAAAAGVPSSKTFFPRPRPSPDERRAPGGQPGHPGKTRERPVPNAPPVVLSLKTCPHCKTPLGDPCDSSSHPVIDLPESSLLIFLLTVHRYKCGGCGERVHAEIPEAFRGDFGPRVKTVVATLSCCGNQWLTPPCSAH